MGCSRYVGRVGALAVVLGVGTVVAFPQTALADDGGGANGASSQQAPSDASGDPSGAASVETKVEPSTVPAADSANTTSADQHDAGSGSPSSTVSAQTNTGTSTQTSTSSTTSPTSNPAALPETTTAPAVEDTTTSEVITPSAPVETVTPRTTFAPDKAPPPKPTPVSTGSAVSAPSAATPSDSIAASSNAPVALRSLRAAASALQSSATDAGLLSARVNVDATAAQLTAPAPVVASDPISALLAVPVSIVTALVNAFLTPIFGNPAAPTQPPLLWAVLGWVRREFDRTFFNSPPTASTQNVAITIANPTATSGPVAFAATDANGDALSFNVPARGAVGGPAHGTVTVDQTTGTFTYDPDDAYALTGGADTFTYTVSDAAARPTFFGIPLSGSVTTATATVNLTLNRVNVAPVIKGDDRITAEDTPITIAVLGNDTDANGDPLTVNAVTQGSHGTTTFTASGVTYTPNTDFNGTDTFTYTATDGASTASGTVTVVVTAVDDSPVAVIDTATVVEDNTTLIDVLANDTDVDAGPKTITGVTQPAHGSVTFTTTGVTYTPTADFNGTDTFTYTLNGGSIATATITVTAVDDAPTAVNDTATVTEDSGTTLIDVLANDADVDAGPKTIAGVTQPTNGAVTFTGTTLSYTPNANFTGTDTFTYTLNGGSIATATITVTAVDDAPTAVNDTATVTEDSGTTLINVLANDADIDAGPKIIAGVTQPTNGAVTFTGTTLSYTPNANFTGTDTFTYTLNGGSIATATITVTAVDDPPVVPNQSFTVVQGTTVAFDIFTGASDVEGDRIYVVFGSVQNVQHGLIYHPGSPETLYTYTPTPGFIGQDTYSYQVQNASGASSGVTTTITFTVVAPPDASPVAVNDTTTVVEDSGTTVIDVLANDTDSDGGPKIITTVAQPTNGTVTFTGTTVSYTPNANFNGTDTFTYTLNGGSTATVAMTVTPVNDAPVTKPMFLDIAEDYPGFYLSPFNGATDPDGDALMLGDVVAPPFGSAIPVFLGGRLLIKYTPLKDYAGPDNWSFAISDGVLTTITTVTVNLSPVNDAPVAVNDTATVTAGGTTTIALIANDNDVDDAVNPATIVITRAPTAGTVTVNPDGTVNYTSTGTTAITDTFTYTVKDASGAASNNATVTVTVTAGAADVLPVAVNDAATVAEDSGSTLIGVLANDTNPDGGPKIITATTQPAHGTVTFTSTTLSYTPTANYNGADTFTYTLNGGSVATVTVTVTPVNDAPVAVNDTATVAEGGIATIALTANDTDVDGAIDPATIVIVRPPAAGTLTVNANGTVTYASNGTEVTSDSFTYTVKDGLGANSNAATVTVTITPVNDAPIAGTDVYTVAGNGTLTVTTPGLLANDSDPEGSAVFITAAIAPRHGTLSSVFSGGGFTYRPDAGYAGPDSFTYTVSDGTATSQGTVNITVTATLNQAPVGVADSYSVAEDGTLTVNGPGLLANDTDAEGQQLSVVSIGTEPTHGSLELRSDGSFTYTPAPNFNGTDTFSYRASDGSADTAPTTVTITVTAVNDVPVITNDTIPIAKDSFGAFALGNRSSDVDGDVLTGMVVSGTQHGTLFFDTVNRGFSYRPNAGYTGQDSFTYKVNDGTVDSAVATVTLVVS